MIGLEYLRKQQKMSLADLGKKLDISRQVIARWENQEQKIPDKRKSELAELFGVSEKYIDKQITKSDEEIIHQEQQINNIPYPYRNWWRIEEDSPKCTVEQLNNIMEYCVDGLEQKEYGELLKYIDGTWSIDDIDDLENCAIRVQQVLGVLKMLLSDKSNILKENELDNLKSELDECSNSLHSVANEISSIGNYIEEISGVIAFSEDSNEITGCDSNGNLYNGRGRLIGQIEGYNDNNYKFTDFENFDEETNEAYDKNNNLIGIIKWFI